MIYKVILRYVSSNAIELSPVMDYMKELVSSKKKSIHAYHYFIKHNEKLCHSYIICDDNESENSRVKALKEYKEKYSKYLSNESVNFKDIILK